MSNALVWDIVALVCIGVAILVTILELQNYTACKNVTCKWIYLFKGAVALITGGVFIASLLRLYPDGARLSPEVGRPTYILLLTALALGAINQRRRGTDHNDSQ